MKTKEEEISRSWGLAAASPDEGNLENLMPFLKFAFKMFRL